MLFIETLYSVVLKVNAQQLIAKDPAFGVNTNTNSSIARERRQWFSSVASVVQLFNEQRKDGRFVVQELY